MSQKPTSIHGVTGNLSRKKSKMMQGRDSFSETTFGLLPCNIEGRQSFRLLKDDEFHLVSIVCLRKVCPFNEQYVDSAWERLCDA